MLRNLPYASVVTVLDLFFKRYHRGNLTRSLALPKVPDMRLLAIIAFVALQLTIYTCGFDIHVHAMESDISHIAEHADDHNGQHNPHSAQHSCHLHASHTFTASSDKKTTTAPFVTTENYHVLADLNLKKLPFRIEHPPKNLHS